MFLITIACLLISLKTVKSEAYVYKSATVLPLNGVWQSYNSNKSINIDGIVPGSIYTDLIRNQIIGDPYFRNNDILYKWIGRDNWTYTKKFDVECQLLQKERQILVLHGVDTVTQVTINDKSVGETDNMFLRYQFDIKSFLQSNNSITVAFESAVEYSLMKHSIQVLKYVIPPTCPPPVQNGECHVNFIRKTQSSFSWDWGPSFPTQGIWKPVEIIGFDTVIIKYITVMTDMHEFKANRTFKTINVTVHMDTANSVAIKGILQIYLNETVLFDSKVVLKSDDTLNVIKTFYLKLPEDFKVKLWWPNGLGDQSLYSLKVMFSTKVEVASKSIQIGFRTVELVQEPIANSTGLSFYFKVNSVPFFAKGSNWIPADSFLERVTFDYLNDLLDSAKYANMNMLRVWGGGIYENDEFYNLADQKGLFIWQDLMFAVALYPVDEAFLNSVTNEITHQVRRLQYHPSLLIWSGNNENEQGIAGYWWPALHQNLPQYKADYVKLYIDTIMPIITTEDPTRPFVPSSPSNGPKSAQEGWISQDPQDIFYGDIHFYTYSGSEWNPSTYPRARFVSEYGFQSYPSFETLAKVSTSDDWVYPFNEFMKNRQHHMFGDAQIARMIEEHFTLPTKSCGTKGFIDVLYLSQIVQAMAIKTETEKYRRSQNEIVDGAGHIMGALYWQLNDIWPGPSWSSIEYGGRWKMLHYYAQKFFAPVLVSPYEENKFVSIYVISDKKEELNLILNISVFQWSSLKTQYSKSIVFTQEPGTSKNIFTHTLSDFLQQGGCRSRNTCFLYFELFNSENTKLSSNVLYLSEFNSVIGLKVPNINVTINGPFHSEFSNFTFSINLRTDAIAPFVWMNIRDVPGRFSDNGFIMLFESIQVFFFSKISTTLEIVSKNFNMTSLKNTCFK